MIVNIDNTCNDLHRCKACKTNINTKIIRRFQYIRTSDYIDSIGTRIIKLVKLKQHNIFPPMISVKSCTDRYTITYNTVGLVKVNVEENKEYVNKWIRNNYIPFNIDDISVWHSQDNLYILVNSDI